MNKLKMFGLFTAVSVAVLALTACGTNEANQAADADEVGEIGAITVVSREEGSGSRAAFEEMVDVNTDEDNLMTADHIIRDGNGVVATFVESESSAIGYVSFATLSGADNLLGLAIDGAEPTVENVLNGTYALSREFNMIFMEENLSDAGRAFVEFMTSVEGLQELEVGGEIVDFENASDFDFSAWEGLTGSLSVGGSTTTERPVMNLANAFMDHFPQVSIAYESSGSGAGIRGAEDGTYEIGFASREVLESELEGGLTALVMAREGIAIVVNNSNPVADITFDQLRDIFLGNVTTWDEVA